MTVMDLAMSTVLLQADKVSYQRVYKEYESCLLEITI